MAEMPNALTPENIAAVAQNAADIIGALANQEQAQRLNLGCNNNDTECCCPRRVKFFIFGNTWINNYNAQCPDALVCCE